MFKGGRMTARIGLVALLAMAMKTIDFRTVAGVKSEQESRSKQAMR
jgi:hypothetical protein